MMLSKIKRFIKINLRATSTFVRFTSRLPNPDGKVAHAHSLDDGTMIGTIKWSRAMNGYAFYPVKKPIMLSRLHLKEIYKYMGEMYG